jgi:hypothetical protein
MTDSMNNKILDFVEMEGTSGSSSAASSSSALSSVPESASASTWVSFSDFAELFVEAARHNGAPNDLLELLTEHAAYAVRDLATRQLEIRVATTPDNDDGENKERYMMNAAGHKDGMLSILVNYLSINKDRIGTEEASRDYYMACVGVFKNTSVFI